jgi:hypothetical protein
VSTLAAIRPDEWNLPLFLHVLGGMVLVGVLVLALLALAAVWRGGSPVSPRLGFRALLWGGIPSFLAMRIGAQWIYDEQGYSGDDDPAWIGIGFMVSDLGLLLLLAATILAGVAVRRAGRPLDSTTVGGGGLGTATAVRVAAGLVGFLIAIYVMAIWAMTTKPV